MSERKIGTEIVQPSSMPIDVGSFEITHPAETRGRSPLSRKILSGSSLIAGIAIALDCGDHNLRAESPSIDTAEGGGISTLAVESKYRLIVPGLASDGVQESVEPSYTVIVPNVSRDGTLTPIAQITSEPEAEFSVVVPGVSRDGIQAQESVPQVTSTPEAKFTAIVPNVAKDEPSQTPSEAESDAESISDDKAETEEHTFADLSTTQTPAPAPHTVVATGVAKDGETTPWATFTVIVPGVSRDVTPTPTPYKLFVGGVTKEVVHE